MGDVEVVEEAVRFSSEGLSLDGRLSYPEAGRPELAVLLLAPHPHMGGRMDNNVVRHLARRAAEDGCVSLRFDWRGIGQSEIALAEGEVLYEHWEAMERAQRYEELLPDAESAFHTLRDVAGASARCVVIGYSLGAILAGMLARSADVARLVGVSPPVARVSLDAWLGCQTPKLFLGGDDDFAFDLARFERELARLPAPKSFVRLAGSDHFFRGEEERVYRALRPFLLDGDAA